MDIFDAVNSGNIALLLASIVVVLAGAVAFLFRLIVAELRARVLRSEQLTDRALEAFDGLEAATTTAVAVARDNAEVAARTAELAQKSLDELRRR